MSIIEYLITKTEPTSLKARGIVLMMTNGHVCRALEISRPINEAPEAYIEANLDELWNVGEPIPMQQFRAATQRAHDPLINTAINAIFSAFTSQAQPAAADIFTAAENALEGTAKLEEWNRLNIMLQSMTDAELRRFLALIIVINLSKSARG